MCPKNPYSEPNFSAKNHQAYDYKHQQYKIFKHQRSAGYSTHLFKHCSTSKVECIYKGKKYLPLPYSS